MTDARFEDARERPLRLLAHDPEDLRVISALVQDAVLTGADLHFDRPRRRFALLVNRFRWEDRQRASIAGRPFERVRALLAFGDVLAIAHQGFDRRDPDTVLSLLAIEFAPDNPAEPGTPAGPGRITLVFAGDGAIALTVECLEVQLADVTRPHAALSRQAPGHGTD